MPTDSPAVLSGPRREVFPTANVREAELSEGLEAERNKAAWNRFIDGTLVEWGRDVAVLKDEGFIPPSLDVVNLACQVAMSLRDAGCAPPTKIVPDGEGGISFERVVGRVSASLRIYADQTGEFLLFDDCRLTERHRLV